MTDSPRDLDAALDQLPPEGGTARIPSDHGETELDVAEVDRLGVRLRGVRVRHEARDLQQEVGRLPGALRDLGEDLQPVEVDPRLGGAVLRTRPDAMRAREFFEVGIRPDETEIRRYQVQEDGLRRSTDWTLTRDQLRRLVDAARDR